MIDITKTNEILQKYKEEEASLIPVLQEVQNIYSYLPVEVLVSISKKLKIPLAKIYGVTTFYAQFYLTPRGKNVVRVCRGTACHVRGGKNVLNAVRLSLGINEGETTQDYKFTFETVACLGACALSPVFLVNKTYYGKLTPVKVKQVLQKYI